MQSPDIYTVSRLNAEVRLALELQFRQLWLCGEVSNFTAASSGHWYFSLKDDAAQVKVAMFKQTNQYATFRPQNGQQVLIRARISVYEPRGEYQLLADFIEPAGEGLLRQQYEQLKAKLTAEGLFAPERKKPLPALPRCIGLITSPSGAAVRDILTVLARRAPSIEVIIYPSLVQGEQAPLALCQALAQAIERKECDVLIIGRGGGALEDLACFNDETLARRIAACPIPIVSAVGHEIDFTIADFVADLRAATPSAAAELVSPDGQAQLKYAQNLTSQLCKQIRIQLQQRHTHLQQLQRHFLRLHPKHKIEQQQQRADETFNRLQRAFQQYLNGCVQRIDKQQQRLQQQNPSHQLPQFQQRLARLHQQLQQAMLVQLKQKQQSWLHQSHALHQISPLATLERGYSILFDAKGSAIRSISEFTPMQGIQIQLHDGKAKAQILAIESNVSKNRRE